MVQHHHRATLKQKNKSFKSRHATKSSIKDIAKGKVPKPNNLSVKPTNGSASRINRKNTAKQTLAAKTATHKTALKLFNGTSGVPRIVTVIPLSADVSSSNIVKIFAEILEIPSYTPAQTTIPASRFKTSLQFVAIPYGYDLFSTLDAVKVADYVVFGLSSTVEVDKHGDTLLRILQSQGMPDIVTVVTSPSDKGVKQSLLSFMQYFSPSQSRIYDLSSASETLNAIRLLAEGRSKEVKWRKGRSYMLADDVSWSEGNLKVTGYVRGGALLADRLVHIPGHGDYRISKILAAPSPRKSSPGCLNIATDEQKTIIAEPDTSSADSLVSRNAPDDTLNEQTWPTEDEMASAPIHMHSEVQGRSKRNLPSGVSEYQAGWIPDDEGEDEEQGDDEDLAMSDEDRENEEYFDANDGEMLEEDLGEEDIDMDSRKSVKFEDLPDDEEQHQLASWLTRSRHAEEQETLTFPDEMDTPKDIPARIRFQRYRGLRSFRTSPWDPYENLPVEYSTIFQFEDFKRTERAMLKLTAEDRHNAVDEGVRVEVWLKDVPEQVSLTAKRDGVDVFAIFSLLKHEHKNSVLNFTVQRNTEYTGSVRSKDPLILCVGPRRLRVNPIYSQHTRGGGKGANNVHKFERFLKSNVTSVATIYGPVTFGRIPCILLREDGSSNDNLELVASGTFNDASPTRIILKRLILSGHPFKVHKKTATVRYLFFNQEDVAYFKPVQLHTKHGRTGHIKESLGTHGYLKAHFDGPISQMDTVCMSLYKRVFPRWSTLWTAKPAAATAEDIMQE